MKLAKYAFVLSLSIRKKPDRLLSIVNLKYDKWIRMRVKVEERSETR